MDRVVPPNSVDDLQPFTYGDLFYADTTSTIAKLPIGSEKNVLNVGAGAPAWTPNLEVTSVTASLRFLGPALRADSSAGVLIENTSGGDVVLFGAGGGQGVTFYDGVIFDAETASRIVTLGSSKEVDTPAAISTAQTLAITATTAPSSSITGSVVVGNGTAATTTGIGGGIVNSGTQVQIQDSLSLDSNLPGLAMRSSGTLAWSSTVNYFNTKDTSLSRYAAGVIALGSGATGSDAGSLRCTNITAIGTTDSTSKDTGSIVTEGGVAGEKNFISAQGIHGGLTSTATAAGTTTLTSASKRTQIFTGTTTQTLQLPAASLFGSGIAVEYIIVNRSTGTVTAQRAGSDTFDGGGTTDAILTNTTRYYVSNGSNQWHTIA